MSKQNIVEKFGDSDQRSTRMPGHTKFSQTKKEQRDKKRQLSDFENDGYQSRAEKIEESAARLVNLTKAGQEVRESDEKDYAFQLRQFRELTERSAFTPESKKLLREYAAAASKSMAPLHQYRVAYDAREATNAQRKAAKRGTTLARMVDALAPLGALAGGENASASSVLEQNRSAINAYEEKTQADLLRVQENLNAANEMITPYLDLHATEEQLQQARKQGDKAAQTRAQDNYRLAYDRHYQALAEKYLAQKDIARLAKEAGEYSADTDQAQIDAGYTGIAQAALGANGAYNPSATKAAADFQKSSDAYQRMKAFIKEKGFEGTDEELEDMAAAIFERSKREVTKERMDKMKAETAAFSEEYPVLASVGDVVLGAAYKLPGAAYSVGKTLEGYISEKPVTMDENSAYFTGSNLSSTIKNTVAAGIPGEFGKQAYLTAMSFGESLSRVALTAALGPAGEATALSLMAAEVMSDTSLQLTQMGYDAKTAGTMAAIAAGAEVVSESVSLEMLFKTFPSAAGVKGFLTKTLTQMFTEGGEEVTSDLINNTADVLMEMFTDNSSQKTKEIESYIKNEGLSFDEAYRKWTTAHLKEYVIDFAAGAVSGGLMGGGYNAFSQGLDLAENTAGLRTENRQARAQLEQNLEKASPEALREALKNSRALRPQLQSLMEKGLAHPDSKVRQQARALQLSAEKTGRVSAVKAGRLINTMNTANTNLSKGVAAARLEQAGADKAVIDAVHAAIEGRVLGKKQLTAIKGNREALSIISELYAQATKSENNPFGEKIYLTSQSDVKLIRQMVSRLPGTALKESGSGADSLSAQAAVFRGAGELGKSGVESLQTSFSPDLRLSEDMHTAAFMLAYNLAQSGKSENEIVREVQSTLPAGDPASERFREVAVLEATLAAKNDAQAQAEESRQAEKSKNPVEDESLQTDRESGIILSRKEKNTGEFVHLQVPMQKRYVKRICFQHSIDLKGITIKIQRSSDCLTSKNLYYGLTDYNDIGRVDLMPQAFIDEEQLLRTIVHEKVHVEQLRKYGKDYVIEHRLEMEKEAYSVENIFARALLKGKKYEMDK